jgi:hypothetical protein
MTNGYQELFHDRQEIGHHDSSPGNSFSFILHFSFPRFILSSSISGHPLRLYYAFMNATISGV